MLRKTNQCCHFWTMCILSSWPWKARLDKPCGQAIWITGRKEPCHEGQAISMSPARLVVVWYKGKVQSRVRRPMGSGFFPPACALQDSGTNLKWINYVEILLIPSDSVNLRLVQTVTFFGHFARSSFHTTNVKGNQRNPWSFPQSCN